MVVSDITEAQAVMNSIKHATETILRIIVDLPFKLVWRHDSLSAARIFINDNG